VGPRCTVTVSFSVLTPPPDLHSSCVWERFFNTDPSPAMVPAWRGYTCPDKASPSPARAAASAPSSGPAMAREAC
jgi:hypothetical protein